jgi:uncharacterized protein with HEPN domain
MHSDRTRAALADVLRNIKLAESFARDVPLQQFMDDVLRVYATTRALEIISEASRRLPDDLKANHPSVPWRRIAGAGNVYRHGYDLVAEEVVWETVQTGLTGLRQAIEAELRRFD